MLLELKGVNTYYGISHILFDVSLEIDRGEVVCILGRNGVGKTSTMRCIMGLNPSRTGDILFDGKSIRKKRPFEIARMGIGYVPEERAIFPDLTVRENLEMGLSSGRKGPWTFDRVCEMFPILANRISQEGGTLSGGEQQMLTIARTLMGNPKLLLLDEPSEGLSPLIVKELEAQVRTLRDEGMPILLSEQNSGFVMRLSDRAYILEKGTIRWKGDTDTLNQNPDILQTYLGV
ncbi:MAG: ABC transporter ATP-binding protein [Deltaproteobacteria bacterium]|jgi:branched-chain amino acid transport system ATP-binding protein|nr:ABC transporter ATP-binding protein [Deltaproteobacteria bacterium]